MAAIPPVCNFDWLAPDFNLMGVDQKKYSLDSVKGKNGTLIMFICNHCPYVIHYHDQLVKLINEYVKKNIEFVAISSNDVENYPQDSPENMKILFKDLSLSIPYLYDESQEIAKKLSKLVRDSLKKVTVSIQGDSLRITGKNKDDLQSAINLIKKQEDDLDIALQFENYR